ncbi:MAG: hypothetical protein ACI9NQ_002196 [Paracoccaceae bacterium]
MAAEHGLNEGVDGSVHDVMDVAGFFAGPEVFDHLVGLEDVGTDLAAPADFTFVGVGAVGLGLLLVLFDLVELGAEGLPGQFAVAELGAFLGRADHDPGGEVLYDDGGLDLVDVLAACSAGAGGGDFDVGVGDFDDNAFVDLGSDIDGGEGGVAFAGAIERGDTDEAMDATFGLEVTVGVGAFKLEGGGGNSGFFTLLVVGHGDLEVVLVGPAAIHAVKHAGPVAGFGASGSGLDGHVGILRIRGGVEEGDELEGFEVFLELLEGGAGFSGGIEVVEFFGEFDAGGEVCEVVLELQTGVEFVLVELGFSEDFAGLVLLVPELGSGGQGFKLGDFLGEERDVKDTS